MSLARLAFISCLLFGSLAVAVNPGFLREFMRRHPLRSVLVITNTQPGEPISSRSFYDNFAWTIHIISGFTIHQYVSKIWTKANPLKTTSGAHESHQIIVQYQYRETQQFCRCHIEWFCKATAIKRIEFKRPIFVICGPFPHQGLNSALGQPIMHSSSATR